MPRRPYRSRKYAEPLPTSLFLIVVLILLCVFAPLSQEVTTFTLGASIFLACIALGVLIAIGIWQWRRRQARWKLLQLVDLDQMTGMEFEDYVGKLLQHQGYSVKFTAASGDFGADIIAKKDGVKMAIQLKRYSSNVGVEAVYQAVGSMAKYGCKKSAVITNSYFTPAAEELARVNKCLLINRDELIEWMVDFQLGKKKNSTNLELENLNLEQNTEVAE